MTCIARIAMAMIGLQVTLALDANLMKPLLGVTPEAMAARAEFGRAARLSQPVPEAIPDSFDSETNWPECAKVIGDIRDQSNCGCCWAFAAAEAASDRLCIATKGAVAVPLSAQAVCFCASEDGCGGGDITSPWHYIKSGVVTGGQYNGTGPLGKGFCADFSLPHCHHHGPQGSDPYPAEGAPGCPKETSPQCPTKCDSAAEAPHNNFASDAIGFDGEVLQVSGADAIAKAIMEGGPVETAFTVYSDFADYSSGIYHHVSGEQLGGHAVRIVGFGVENGEKYWKVANSWNPYWGEKGYFRIRRGNNDCGIEDMVTASSATAKWSKGSDSKVAVHPERAAMIREIESTPGVLWKAAAHPRFASEAPGASADLCGVKGDQKEIVQDLVERGEIEEASLDANAELPENFDSEQNWPQCAKTIGDIRDQSNCGCCWAFAGAEAASDRMCISTNASMLISLSAQDVCFNGGGLMSQGCNGGQITSPWSFMKKGGLFGGKGAVSGGQYQGTGAFGKGLCSDFSLPHCHHHGPQGDDPYPAEGQPGCPHESSPDGPKQCDADAVAPHNDFAADKYSYTGSTVKASGESGIQQAIAAGGPMEVAFSVYSDFENYVSGIYHHVSGSQVGGHAVKVVGWGVDGGVKYWKIANSWNPHWGEKGYFRIRRGNNEGGIEDQAVASSPTAKWSRAGDATVVV